VEKPGAHPCRLSGHSFIHQGLKPLLCQNLSGFRVYHNYGIINWARNIFFASLAGLLKLGLAKAGRNLYYFFAFL
jgi:hypothetical protein